MEDKKQSDTEIFKWFKEHVLDSKLEPSIGHHELVSPLSLYTTNLSFCPLLLAYMMDV